MRDMEYNNLLSRTILQLINQKIQVLGNISFYLSRFGIFLFSFTEHSGLLYYSRTDHFNIKENNIDLDVKRYSKQVISTCDLKMNIYFISINQ